MKKVLLILNGPAYGADETYNAVRLALALSRRTDAQPRIFLMGDAVTCAVAGQQTPNGYCTLDRLLSSFARHGGQIACCGTCLDARGSDQGTPHRRGRPVHRGRTGRLDGRGRGRPHLLELTQAGR